MNFAKLGKYFAKKEFITPNTKNRTFQPSKIVVPSRVSATQTPKTRNSAVPLELLPPAHRLLIHHLLSLRMFADPLRFQVFPH